jgi:hypothetical protein
MCFTFSSDVPGRPEDFCFATHPVSLNFSNQILKPYHLVLFLLDVNFATYVALLQPISILHAIKQLSLLLHSHTSRLTLTPNGR